MEQSRCPTAGERQATWRRASIAGLPATSAADGRTYPPVACQKEEEKRREAIPCWAMQSMVGRQKEGVDAVVSNRLSGDLKHYREVKRERQ